MADAPGEPAAPATVALVRDLMFATRIRSAAQDLNLPIRVLRDAADLACAGGLRLVVDLNQDGAIDAAAAWRAATGGVVIGFVSHVDVDTVRRAREAGIDQVMARSQFVKVLPDLLVAP